MKLRWMVLRRKSYVSYDTPEAYHDDYPVLQYQNDSGNWVPVPKEIVDTRKEKQESNDKKD